MAKQITAHELRELVEDVKLNISHAKEAIASISQKLDQGYCLSLSDEHTVNANQALMDCVSSWTKLEQISGSAEDRKDLSAFESWIGDLERDENLDVLRDYVTAYFRIHSSSDKYAKILEDSKKELQDCCRLEAEALLPAIKPYEITVRAIQGEDISDEDDDILMENSHAVHQVYFKRTRMSIDAEQSISAYMDGSCRLLTATSEKLAINLYPLWDGFSGYVSNEPIYIEHNPEADKAFPPKEFASRMKSHPYQFEMLGKINDHVVWPINEPKNWCENIGDITYFLNHGYIVRIGYEEGKPLFYALSSKGKTAIRYFFEKINKQPRAMLTKGNYPELDQLSVLNLKRIFVILNHIMTHEPVQYSFMRTSKEWYRAPYACVYNKENGNDDILSAGYYSIGNEQADISGIQKLITTVPDSRIQMIVANMGDSRYILECVSADEDTVKRISFVEDE